MNIMRFVALACVALAVTTGVHAADDRSPAQMHLFNLIANAVDASGPLEVETLGRALPKGTPLRPAIERIAGRIATMPLVTGQRVTIKFQADRVYLAAEIIGQDQMVDRLSVLIPVAHGKVGEVAMTFILEDVSEHF